MKTKLTTQRYKTSILLLLGGLCVSVTTFQSQPVEAQCYYNPTIVTCHPATYTTNNSCCDRINSFCFWGALPIEDTTSTKTYVGTTAGMCGTCEEGGGSEDLGEYSATCGYNKYGVNCYGPYGPTAKTSQVSEYTCTLCHGSS